MECNKDEAVRAKTIAEGKMESKDYSGAKKFALKAQNLYPSLVGIAQMLTTIDVYVSAENKITGEVDWYGVLGVTPSVDDETLRKRYRKLALVLHPDKNKSNGADGAFKLLSEAWSVLSDKSKRLAYDQRRGLKRYSQKVTTHTSGHSVPSQANGSQSFSSMSAAISKTQNTIAKTPPKPQKTTANAAPPKAQKATTKAPLKAQNTTAKAPPKAQNTTAQAPPRAQNITAKAPLKAQNITAKAPLKAQNITAKAPLKAQNITAQARPEAVPTSFQQRSNNFWTICHRCKMHYEYLKVYLNRVLRCPNCREPFLASETYPPSSHYKSSNLPNFQYNQGSSARRSSGSLCPGINAPRSVPTGQTSSSNAELQRGLPKRSAVGNSLDPSIGSTQAQRKMKRERDVSNIHSFFSAGETPLKKSRVGAVMYPFGENMDHQAAMGNNGFGNFNSGLTKGVFDTSWGPGFPRKHQKPKGFGELTPTEFRKMLRGKCQYEIQMKLNGWKSVIVTEAADVKKENVKAASQENYKEKQHNMNEIDKHSPSERSDPVKNSCYSASDDAKEGGLVAESMSVPDPDFHDFDTDRSESSFGEGEVWAAYDDDDGMPRFYAMISNVISRGAFEVRLSWLNSKTNNEFSTIDWVGSGFYKTCGEFRVGRYRVSTSINTFSHKVKYFKGPRGTIHILPKKGDVWALYSNWSSDWNEHTPDEVIHKYEMTLVLDDYNEEQGISVVPLVKVAGFRTVFYQHMNPEKIKRIPKEEMFRFSHQVPNYLLRGEEVKNAPNDCQELDPAATPVELLQVASEDEEGQVTNNYEDAKVMEMQRTAQVG